MLGGARRAGQIRDVRAEGGSCTQRAGAAPPRGRAPGRVLLGQRSRGAGLGHSALGRRCCAL